MPWLVRPPRLFPAFSRLLLLIGWFFISYPLLSQANGIQTPPAQTRAADTQAPEAWEARFQHAEWVARVRIESISSLVNPVMSHSGVLAIQGYRYHASVMTSWKGGQGGTIKFRVDLSDCRELLEVDREYVVFGFSNRRGALRSRDCDDIISVEQAGPVLGFLHRYRQSRNNWSRRSS